MAPATAPMAAPPRALWPPLLLPMMAPARAPSAPPATAPFWVFGPVPTQPGAECCRCGDGEYGLGVHVLGLTFLEHAGYSKFRSRAKFLLRNASR